MSNPLAISVDFVGEQQLNHGIHRNSHGVTRRYFRVKIRGRFREFRGLLLLFGNLCGFEQSECMRARCPLRLGVLCGSASKIQLKQLFARHGNPIIVDQQR